ncbi:2236_t:CDS:2, partial [Entrophospora sp. SA101]
PDYLQELVNEYQDTKDQDALTENDEKLKEFGIGGLCNLCLGIPLIIDCLNSNNEDILTAAITILIFLLTPPTLEIAKTCTNNNMSQLPEGDEDGGSSYQPQSEFIKESGRDNEVGGGGSSHPHHNRQQGDGSGIVDSSGIYDENFFPSPTHPHHHHKGGHHRQQQQIDKLVDQEFFNDFPDDFDDEDLS